MQDIRTPLFNQNPNKIEKQQVEMATETVKKKEVNEELSLEETAKRITKYLANAHRIKDKFEPVLRKIRPDIDTITVYELIEDVKNLDFEGCDCLIKLKDGTEIHAALRENTGGIEWYTQASMLRRSSVRRHEGKAIQSIEIQMFKENKQIHILDSDEVYKIAHEFQKHNKLEGFCEKLDEMAKERNIFKYKFYKYANWVTKDSENPNAPEREDAIRIKYVGYDNFTNLDNVPQNPKIVEILHKWEKYNLNGKLIKKGSQGVDLHSEYYKEKTKKLKEMFPEETRLVDEKETAQKKELFAIHKDPESDKDSGGGNGAEVRYGRLFGGSKNTNSEKGANRMNTHVEEKSIQKLEVDNMKDFEVGYDSKAGEFCMYESRNGNVHVREEYIDDFKDKVKEKITQLLEYGTDNDELACKFEEIKELQRDDFTGNYNLIKNLKDQIGEYVDGILDTVNFERLEMAPLETASIKKDTEKMKEEAEKQMPDPGDSKDLAPAGSSLRGRKGAEK